jgi:mRNA interferase MazF
MMSNSDAPERGDVIRISINPQAGHEQAGRGPVLVLSLSSYNRKVGLVIICPITNQVKGYPFEVELPKGLDVAGAVLSDQVKSFDWNRRKAEQVCKVPQSIVLQVLKKLNTLIQV